MDALRRQQYALTMELETLEYARKLRSSKSVWEGFARRQALERQAAVFENAQLKKVLQHHADVLSRLRAVVEPATMSCRMDDDLVLAHVTRGPLPRNWSNSTLHERLDAQKALLPSIFRKHGLDCQQDSWKQIVSRVDTATGDIVLEISTCLVVHAGFADVGDAMSCIYTPKQPLHVENRSIEILEIVDASSHIGEHVHCVASETFRRRFARKCSALHDRIVFVEQTIEADHGDRPYTETKYEALEYLRRDRCHWKMFRCVRLPVRDMLCVDLQQELMASFAASMDNVIDALESVVQSLARTITRDNHHVRWLLYEG
ncbi:hypothetical protein SPRG_15422 [Saprolegnia parasitica CBS 223.65]|uniref:START domain-containing protein n=1 Tax=Saprolegnia parasitica (strain CBS 223.65) TaxID=695850 RepID=A0A067BXX3_SAPPC|nr:hypothetical protein SPRG_15422 [Saprolegnia parasitica CBS 223.65]KDO19432.1 hypothetical protein SPRG_15422 [Saprolegnia parasitica CBS 223.65]|eukprot:XP_012209858.1 hypothetical protein SPRG_15422 [Saprolegnia parasitica CBS 223.65]